jgi:hypothetical protein
MTWTTQLSVARSYLAVVINSNNDQAKIAFGGGMNITSGVPLFNC